MNRRNLVILAIGLLLVANVVIGPLLLQRSAKQVLSPEYKIGQEKQVDPYRSLTVFQDSIYQITITEKYNN